MKKLISVFLLLVCVVLWSLFPFGSSATTEISGSLRRITITGVDVKTLAATPIYTTEGGHRFHPVQVIFTLATASSITVAPAVSLGTNSTSFNDILAITTLTGLTAVNTTLLVNLGTTSISSVAAATAIDVKVTTAATGTSGTLRIDIIGFYE